MTYSLIACRQKAGLIRDDQLSCQNHWWNYEAMGWHLYLRSLASVRVEDRVDISPDRVSIVVGSPTNIELLRSIAVTFDGAATTASTAQLFRILYSVLGPTVFGIVDGPFNYFEFTKKNVFIVNDALGMQPVHVVQGKNVWLCSELKHVGKAERGIFRFHPIDQVLASTVRADNYLPIDNALRLKPGTHTTLYEDGFEKISLNTVASLVPRVAAPQNLLPTDAKQRIAGILTSTVHSSVATHERILIPLSGGLDSSMVTSMASRARSDIETFALGTGRSNEFPFARIVADHLKTTHTEINYTSSEIIDGVHHAIYHNEIFDGLSAEIQSTLMCFYRSVGANGGRVITGYGSDLLFGGVLSTTDAIENVNADLWAQIYRTRWTGEFSSFGAAAFGLDVQHPFWRPSVIGFAASLAPELKLSARDVKITLRECAEEYDLLPASIVWRKKIGIHEGSSVNQIFSDHIGVNARDYQAKTTYSYKRYTSYMNGDVSLHDGLA